MVKLITTKKWQCTVCEKTFTTRKDAIICEKNKPDFYPIGCIHGGWDNDLAGDTLAVACNYFERHCNFGAAWWCKEEDDIENMGFYDGICNHFGQEHKADKTLKSFKHMVKWLQEQGIKITVWDGKKVVKLKEFLK